MTDIGPQHGIDAFLNWLRQQPDVPKPGPNYDPNNHTTWPWPERLHRTLRMLAAAHDAEQGAPDPPPDPTDPPPDPPPSEPRLAPRAYNKGTNDSDPRFCVFLPDGNLRPGITKIGTDLYVDEGGYRYNGDGLGQDGGNWRNRDRMVPNLLPANSMDGRPVCQAYVNNGVTIGGSAGYPPESFLA